MKKFLLLSILLVCLVPAFGQLTVNSTLTPQQLVQNYLVGSGVTVSNVTFNGTPGTTPNPQIGYFQGASSNVGLTDGVIMASGAVTNAIGPNNSGGITTAYNNSFSDPDLSAICAFGVYDVAVLQFDFVPQGDTVEFKFVFASDEYIEYVGSGINDAFGIFISGPGITGPFTNNAANMAVVPGTSLPISIDNVSPWTNASYYIDNGDGYTAPYNSNPMYIQYDGLTVTITAKYPVQCGQTYHIKFAIGDGADNVLDSGVFIEAGSFSSNGMNVTLEAPVLPNIAAGFVYEGCLLGSSVDIVFVRPDVTGADTTYFNVGGDAINGSDYSTITNSYVVFPPGEDSAILSVTIFNDGIIEGTDTLTISVTTTNSCGGSNVISVNVYIQDPYDVIPFAGNDTVYYCPGQILNLNGIMLTGLPPYNYTWSNGTTTSSVSYTITQLGSDTLILDVIDGCGYTGTDTLFISQSPPPALIADAGNDITITCPGQTIVLDGAYYNSVVPTTYMWLPNVFDTLLVVQPLQTTQYIFSATNSCGQADTDTVTVFVPPYTPFTVFLSDSVLTVTCPGDNDSVTGYALSGGTAPYSYFWSNGDLDSNTSVNILADGNLELIIVDACGLDTAVYVALELDYSPVNLGVLSGRYCRNNDSTVIVPYTLSGGSEPFSFGYSSSVTNGTMTTDTIAQVFTIEYPQSGQYFFTVTDGCGNSDVDSASIIMDNCDLMIPNVISPNGDGVNDVFFVDGLQYHPNSILRVYDRWGVLVYMDTDYQNNWNGNGVTGGIYFYIIELTDGTIPAQYNGFLHIYY
jgi:gliding motility-associated-like protein